MIYEFQSTFFKTVRQMSDAIADEWLSAGGSNNPDTQRDFLDTKTDADLANDAIEAWDLNDEWAKNRDFTRDNLIEAFSRLRHLKSA